ncbi:MAG: TOBE domain-containing protein [Rhodospirillaceae bacterium]
MRPEHIELVATGAGQIDGTVDVLEYLGADTFVILSCGHAGQVTVRVNGTATVKPGDQVGLSGVFKSHDFSSKAQSVEPVGQGVDQLAVALINVGVGAADGIAGDELVEHLQECHRVASLEGMTR